MEKIRDAGHLASVQYATPAKFNARKNLQNYTFPPLDIYQEALSRLSLKGDEDILEVGCGEGKLLLDLRRRGHKGRLIGLDISEGMFYESNQTQQREGLNIEYVKGNADNLPFIGGEFDVILGFFMIYHVPNVDKALFNWNNCLTHDGKLIISTFGAYNRPKFQEMKVLAGKLTGTKHPTLFSERFNLENGEPRLSDFFKIEDKATFDRELVLTDPQPYIAAMDSLRDMFEPIPTDAQWVTAKFSLESIIREEIQSTGRFVDPMKEGFWVCKKR